MLTKLAAIVCLLFMLHATGIKIHSVHWHLMRLCCRHKALNIHVAGLVP